jgi:glycosyltransferase involved in cell wall biosynthesis
MRILILNWRCPRNPKAGGAEAVTLQIARRLVLAGHEVEWFSATFPGAPESESFEGIRFVRAGRQATVHWKAFRRYRGKLRGVFDIVVDEVNTIPFLTPLWADIPTVAFIHQLARQVWWYETPFPLNALGYSAEPIYLRPYRRGPVLTVSESTKQDLLGLGFTGPITVLPQGLEEIDSRLQSKSDLPTVLYVGRMAPSKRVDDVIRAFAIFTSRLGAARLWLIGDGSPNYLARLRRVIESLGIAGQVEFLGRVSNAEKHRRMAQAHVLTMASAREGWGLVVIEANACGTPAVVYDVAGLRDAVVHEETGLLVPASPEALAGGLLRLWMEPSLRERLSVAALERSKTFSFDNTASAAEQRIAHLVTA